MRIQISHERIRNALKERGLTQKGLCARLGVSPEHFSRCLKSGSVPEKWVSVISEYTALPPYLLFDNVVMRADFGNGEKEYTLDDTGTAAFWVTERDTMLSNYDSVSEDGKRLIEDYVKLIASHPDYKDK